MIPTDEQMAIIRQFRKADIQYREQQELRAGIADMKVTIRHVLAQPTVFEADIVQLNEALPGITTLYARAMGFSEEDFQQALKQGLVLKESLKRGLEAILNDPLLQI